MFGPKNLLFIGLFLLKYCQIVLTERSLPECKVDKYSNCVLGNSEYLDYNEYCIDENNIIHKGIKSKGKCIVVGYSDPEESILDKRGTGSNDGDEKIGYFLKIEKDGKIVTLDTKGSGKLYYCYSSSNCEEINKNNVKSGYYRNADSENTKIPYIKCTKGSNYCETIEIESNDCSIGAGNIIGVEKNNSIIFKLCLNEEKSVPLTVYTKYFISVNTMNVFGQSNNKYAMVEISNENALKIESEFEKYQFTDSNLEIQSKKGNTEICKNKEKINEFELVDTINYYYTRKDDNE